MGLSKLPCHGPTDSANLRCRHCWLRPEPSDPVKIDANENPYGPSEKALQAIQKSFSQSGRYASNTPELHRALCSHHQVDSGMLELGYGSSELLKMAAEAFLGPGKNVVTAQPTYEAPSRYGAVYDATTISCPARLTVQARLEEDARRRQRQDGHGLHLQPEQSRRQPSFRPKRPNRLSIPCHQKSQLSSMRHIIIMWRIRPTPPQFLWRSRAKPSW